MQNGLRQCGQPIVNRRSQLYQAAATLVSASHSNKIPTSVACYVVVVVRISDHKHPRRCVSVETSVQLSGAGYLARGDTVIKTEQVINQRLQSVAPRSARQRVLVRCRQHRNSCTLLP
jgi:hypothetical protein